MNKIILKDEPLIEYDRDNFTLQIQNENLFFDYRSGCKITEGKLLHLKSACIDDTSCQYRNNNIEDFENFKNKCINFSCPNNKWWTPKNKLKFWKKQLCALHSPIRGIHFRIIDFIPKSVAMQLVRHTMGHPQPYIQSSRPDWTGVPRSKDPYENRWCAFDFTPESFLFMCRKRLCNRTEIMTRKIVNSWVEKLKEIDEEDSNNGMGSLMSAHLFKALGEMSVPQCEVLGANKCPELKSCGKHEPFIF